MTAFVLISIVGSEQDCFVNVNDVMSHKALWQNSAFANRVGGCL